MSATKDALKPEIIKKSFDRAEETRKIEKGHVEIVKINNQPAMRLTFEPGWRWSECVKPAAGTDTCQVDHLGYMATGRMIVKMDDGKETEFKAGDFGAIPAGHDA